MSTTIYVHCEYRRNFHSFFVVFSWKIKYTLRCQKSAVRARETRVLELSSLQQIIFNLWLNSVHFGHDRRFFKVFRIYTSSPDKDRRSKFYTFFKQDSESAVWIFLLKTKHVDKTPTFFILKPSKTYIWHTKKEGKCYLYNTLWWTNGVSF